MSRTAGVFSRFVLVLLASALCVAGCDDGGASDGAEGDGGGSGNAGTSGSDEDTDAATSEEPTGDAGMVDPAPSAGSGGGVDAGGGGVAGEGGAGGSEGAGAGGAAPGGAPGSGEIVASGSIDGEAFTVHCFDRTTGSPETPTGGNYYDTLCRAGEAGQEFEGPVSQVNVNFRDVEPGMYTLGPSGDPVAAMLAVIDPMFIAYRPELAEEVHSASLELVTVDDTVVQGSFDGAWLQYGVEIEFAVQFNIPVKVP